MFLTVCAVRKELMSLLDSLLNLQHSLLLRHRDTHTLVSTQPDESVAGSDEEIPSDSGSNEESSDREGEELAEERKQRQRRRRRKRKCPWVRYHQQFMMYTSSDCDSSEDLAMKSTYQPCIQLLRDIGMTQSPNGTPN